ncbi:MAG: hypothetical protein ABIA59_02535, partial [Candidatus Latescibacterota bacterium]
VLFIHERAGRIDKEIAYRNIFLTSVSETQILRKALESLLDEQARLKEILIEAGMPVYDYEGNVILKVLATGYSSSEMETDDTPFITAANTRTRQGVVALSRDLLKPYTPDAPFSFGDHIIISGLGEFIVEDSMNDRWQKRMDIWFPSRQEAFHFGKKNLYISKLTGHTEPLDNPSYVNGALQ